VREREKEIEREKERENKVLAHMIMEAEKPTIFKLKTQAGEERRPENQKH
jgi:hypothetical protein